MSIKHERNDHKSSKLQNRPQKSAKGGSFVGKKTEYAPRIDAPARQKHQNNHRHKVSDDGFIWGVHAVNAALKNSLRQGPLKLFLSVERHKSMPPAILKRDDLLFQVLDMAEISRQLPQGAVHQGMALKGPVLEGEDLESLMECQSGVILMLDQVTDPQNIGAIFRSSAAFGVRGLIFQDRHSPPMQGVLAKTAAGAVDSVLFSRVTNLSRALETLSDNGWMSIGLAGDTTTRLQDIISDNNTHKKIVLVLGSEGEGLRRLVSEHCDHLAKIPMPGDFESLNVSHAASISLYELLGRS